MRERLKTIILIEDKIDAEIDRTERLIKLYEGNDKENVLMYLKGVLETLKWIKEVRLNG
ncbi:unknown [Clostridium sp. CAG:575]|jgi:hypothetical protein|nr:unknown [Clostridium sp. CAG:575]